MGPVAPLSAVEARIATIRQRVVPAAVGAAAGDAVTAGGGAGGAVVRAGSASEAARSALSLDTTAPDPFASGWDPFGEVYQAALEERSSIASPVSGAMWSGAMPLFGTESAYATYAGSGAYAGIEGMSAVAWSGVPGQSIGRIGGYGPMPVPGDLLMYGNGRIPPGVLQPIGQGGHVLYAPAAEAWKAAVQAAAADGIQLRITDSYRTYDQQVDLVERKGLYSQGGYGAVPGTSNHGWGLAVDIDVNDPSTLAWVRANAYRFGFVEAVPREPWHWEFRPTQA